MLSSNLKAKIKEQAFRAPSVHNVQPWALQFADNSLLLFDDLKRTLPIGDAQLHDHEVSLGAFIEGVHLILSTEGLGLSKIEPLDNSEVTLQGRKLRRRYRLSIGKGFPKDALADLILQRKSYRGKFLKSSAADCETLQEKMTSATSALIIGKKNLKIWAQKYDKAAVEGNSHRPLQEELYHWMRFDSSHADYHRDGLNREALSLSSFAGWAARSLLKPTVYCVFDKVGIGGALMTEAPQILSSSGLLVIFKNPDISPLENGRQFYRHWLTLTSHGFFACPLSALVDNAQSRESLEHLFPGKKVLNVLRVGKAPLDIYTSPRLPAAETLIGDEL